MSYDNGRFVWFEHVAKSDTRSSSFYAEVMGWKLEVVEMPGGMKYPMAACAAGMVGGFAEPEGTGTAPHWVSYVSVADVDAAGEKVVALGGRALAKAFDVPTVGRMMPVTDPHGAPFYLFRGENGDEAAKDGPGAFHWNELLSDDPEAAVAFYEKALGYTHETMNMGGGTYFILKNGDKMRGGVTKPNGLSSGQWIQYVTVDDCDAAVTRTKKSGGKVIQAAADVPGVGRIAVIQDPVGAQIGLIKPAAA